jgi:hypothetical protein
MQRILRGDDEKRLGQGAGDPVDRDLAFFHCLEQSALRFRAGAIDFVGQQHFREDRAGMKGELRTASFVDRHANHVGGQQVAGELHAPERQPERGGDGVRQGRLAHAGGVFDQQVAAGQQAGQALADLQILADDDRCDAGCAQA